MQKYPLALVTGGAHRLGRAFALTLAYQGYAVLVHYFRAASHVQKTLGEIKGFGVPGFSIQADLTNPEHIHGMFTLVDSLLDAPDSKLSHFAVLVNSAAIMPKVDVASLTLDSWDETLNLNLRAPFLCAQQASLRMAEGGLIINVTDVGANKAWSRFPSYSVSKAGLESLTKVLARAFAPGIRVNAIAPGLTLPPENHSSEDWDRLVARLPLKRSALTEEVASALEFLLKNEYITGQTITVDGGYSLV